MPIEHGFTVGDLTGWDGDETHDGQHGHRFPATALAHYGDGFSMVKTKGNAVDGIDCALRDVKTGMEILDL
jgi:hypothetical protein